MRDAELEQFFPKMQSGGYDITSPRDKKYNCVAWAVGSVTLWWQLVDFPSRVWYWPLGIDRDDTLEGWVKVFQLHGYVVCEDASWEDGTEKVAIYVSTDATPSHVAKQGENSRWKSKLGKGYDIEHDSLEILEGEEGQEYGKAMRFLRRSLKPSLNEYNAPSPIS